MPAIRRHVHIAASPRAVWRALTTAEGLEDWLVDEARFDGRLGGRVVFSTTDGQTSIEEHGLVHKWRPISQLEIAWDKVGDFDSRGSRVAFQVARDGTETRLSLVHSGGEGLEDEETHARIDERWRVALETVQALLDES